MSEKTTKPSVKTPIAQTASKKQVTKSPSNPVGVSRSDLSASTALTPAKVLALQRTAGNGAVQRLLAQHQVQAKLTVGPVNDHYEQEADRVAAQVMSQPAAASATASVQREAAPEEEEKVQAKPLANGITPLVQREAAPEEEEQVQAKMIQREAAPEEEEQVQAKMIQREAAPEEEEQVQAKLIQRESAPEEEEQVQAKMIQREAAPEEEEQVQAKMIQREAAPEEEEQVQAKMIQREAAPEEEEQVQAKMIQREAARKEEEQVQAKMIQREAAPEEEEQVQAKMIQREAAPEEEEQVQAKGGKGEAFEPGEDFEKRLSAAKNGGQPIPEQILVFMESRFGADFSAVRIHTGGEAIQLTREIGAQAFTRGNDIYLGAGKENLESNAGQELLAHELTHVVQQTGATSKK